MHVCWRNLEYLLPSQGQFSLIIDKKGYKKMRWKQDEQPVTWSMTNIKILQFKLSITQEFYFIYVAFILSTVPCTSLGHKYYYWIHACWKENQKYPLQTMTLNLDLDLDLDLTGQNAMGMNES